LRNTLITRLSSEESAFVLRLYLCEKEIACILISNIFPILRVIQNIKESNHVSAISLSENNGDSSICVLENLPNPN
jgi:hypothetical protein